MPTDPVYGVMLLGAIGAIIVIFTCKAIAWYFDLYVGIFRAGVGICWDRWSPGQRVLFILGLLLWVVALALMFIFHIVAIIAVIYLGVSIMRWIM